MWLDGFKMAEVGTGAIVHHVKWLTVIAPHLSVNASMPSECTLLSRSLKLSGFNHVGPTHDFI
jgi:hypothetical protein